MRREIKERDGFIIISDCDPIDGKSVVVSRNRYKVGGPKAWLAIANAAEGLGLSIKCESSLKIPIGTGNIDVQQMLDRGDVVVFGTNGNPQL